MTRRSNIRSLAEVNVRVGDLKKMTKFYVDVLGLKPVYKSSKHVFLKVRMDIKATPK
jgi:catechol-2,3-dioxygenase